MPKQRRSRRRNIRDKHKKATSPKRLRWLSSKLSASVRYVLVEVVICIILSVVQPYITDSYWGTSPTAIKVQYYSI